MSATAGGRPTDDAAGAGDGSPGCARPSGSKSGLARRRRAEREQQRAGADRLRDEKLSAWPAKVGPVVVRFLVLSSSIGAKA